MKILPTPQQQEEWSRRAKRQGYLSIASTLHTLEQVNEASEVLVAETLSFLDVHYGPLHSSYVVDVGCGVGRFTVPLAERANKVLAVDFNNDMLDRCKEATKGCPNVEYSHSDISDLVIDGNFDLVFAVTVLLHIVDPVRYSRAVQNMKYIGNSIFICESIGNDTLLSPFTILRSSVTYVRDFEPLELVAEREHCFINERYNLMLFRKK